MKTVTTFVWGQPVFRITKTSLFRIFYLKIIFSVVWVYVHICICYESKFFHLILGSFEYILFLLKNNTPIWAKNIKDYSVNKKQVLNFLVLLRHKKKQTYCKQIRHKMKVYVLRVKKSENVNEICLTSTSFSIK